MNRRKFLTGLLAGFTLLITASFSFAQGSSAELNELKQRFKDRHPVLTQLNREGKVGETYLGLAEVVKPEYNGQKADPDDKTSPTIAAFVQTENNDRNRLYQLLAERSKTTPQKVAERDAIRRFEKAEPNEMLKPEGLGWMTKREYDQRDKN